MTLRVGVLGTRHVHAAGLARIVAALGHDIVGATERDPLAAREWVEVGLAPIVDDPHRLVESCDAVIVAGTNRERVDDAIVAIEAGIPVLCEKPVAIDGSDLERLVAAIAPFPEERFMVALPVRFSGAMQRARDLIQGGHVGDVLAARGTNHGQFPGGWFGDAHEAGGGAIMDHTVHVSDGLCWLLGDRIRDVYAEAATRMHGSLAVDDCGVLTFSFAGGAFASLDASWSRPTSFATWGDVWIEVVGTRGRLVIDPMARHLDLFDDRVGRMRTVGYGSDDMTRAMVQAFLTFAVEGGPSPVPLADGVHASDVVLAAYRSAASHRVELVTERDLATASPAG